MLDERRARRPTFLGGRPIRLADDRAWRFPGPEAGTREDFGPNYPALIAAWREAEDESERLHAAIALAILLLTVNYDLGPDDLGSVLGWPPGDPGLSEVQRGFRDLAAAHAGAARATSQARPEPAPSRARPSRSLWAGWARARSRRD